MTIPLWPFSHLVAGVVVVAASCTSRQSESSPVAGAPEAGGVGIVERPPADIDVRWCEAEPQGCFRCATVRWPSSRPCAEGNTCNGLCFETETGRRCLQYDRVCPPHASRLAKPDAVGTCGVTCGDPDGDGHYDRCIERLQCPTRSQEKDWSGHYAVRHPLELYETLCGGVRDTALAELERSLSGEPDCDATPLYWVIAPETMKHASDATGPGLCYGIVADEGAPTEYETCGKHHCQTLRYCDGRERTEHCTIYAACQNDRYVPERLGW